VNFRFNPHLVASRIRELSDEVAALRMDVSPMYAELLLKYASYDKGQQDRWVSCESRTKENSCSGRIRKIAVLDTSGKKLFWTHQENSCSGHIRKIAVLDTSGK
jgi:hypothetical protein